MRSRIVNPKLRCLWHLWDKDLFEQQWRQHAVWRHPVLWKASWCYGNKLPRLFPRDTFQVFVGKHDNFPKTHNWQLRHHISKFLLANSHRSIEDDEPYILALEARQVYYVEDGRHRDWNMVVHLKPRDLYDIGDGDNIAYESEPFQPAISKTSS